MSSLESHFLDDYSRKLEGSSRSSSPYSIISQLEELRRVLAYVGIHCCPPTLSATTSLGAIRPQYAASIELQNMTCESVDQLRAILRLGIREMDRVKRIEEENKATVLVDAFLSRKKSEKEQDRNDVIKRLLTEDV